MSPSYRNPKCRHSRERHTADLEFCRHRLLIVTVMVRRQDNDQMRDVHGSAVTIHDGIQFVPCHHDTADEQDNITETVPIVEESDGDHVDQTPQWRICLLTAGNQRVRLVMSGRSIGMTPARQNEQAHSIPPHRIEPKVVHAVVQDYINIPHHTLARTSNPIGSSSLSLHSWLSA